MVHQGLCQCGGVLLVVTQLAKANNIDHDVTTKFHAEIECQARGERHGLRVVAVDVKHRRFDHLGHVGTVDGRTRIAWIRSRKANLVIDHQVNRATRAVTAGLGKVECFHHHTLAGEGSVAVHQHRQDLLVAVRTASFLASAYAALYDRVDDFKV